MGDINPLTTTTTAGYTTKARNSFYIDDTTTTAVSTVNKRRRLGRHQILSYHLGDWDNGDTIKTTPGVMAAAWQANTTDDQANVSVGGTAAAPTLTFNTAATNPDGWVHLIVQRSSGLNSSTTSDTITAKGTAGYVDPRRGIYLNHRSATPNTLTNAKIGYKDRYRVQVFPFVMGSQSDLWKCASGTRGTDTLCPGIVAVAWQPNQAAAANRVAVTLDEDGDVVFTCPSGTPTGWLWVWRAA